MKTDVYGKGHNKSLKLKYQKTIAYMPNTK